MTAELAFASAGELAAKISSGALSAVELTQFFISRIEASHEQLNAVVVQDFDAALEAAKQADAAQAAGRELGPLHGVPVTVKESFDLAGHPTTWGFPMWQHMRASQDAEVVNRLKAAGAVVLGKTNVPVMLSDFQSFNEIYGQTNNPWNPALVPGGSSGGSAAAMAAGLSGLEFGSDIGGSVRNPAHYCGVYGHKPTWNVVPITGHKPPVAPSEGNGVDIAVVGPIARQPEDLRLALSLTSGPLPLQAPGWQLHLPPAPVFDKQRPLRVAVWANDAMAPVSDDIAAGIEAVANALESNGAVVDRQVRPDIDFQAARLAYVYLMQAVNVSGVPDQVYQQNLELAKQFDSRDMSPPALFARASVQSHHEWMQHDHLRTAVRYAWHRFFADWDVLLCPIANTAAFPHNHGLMEQRLVDVNGEMRPYFEANFWASLASLAGLPATVAPMGLNKEKLPLGVQIVGAEFADETTIAVSGLLKELGFSFTPPPALAGSS